MLKRLSWKAIGILGAVTALFFIVYVVSSPQYFLYKINQAAAHNNQAEFFKYYNVPQPKSNGLDKMSKQERDTFLFKKYKNENFKNITLLQAFFGTKYHKERFGGGVLLFLKSGKDEDVYRMVRDANVWKVNAAARLKN